MDMELTGFKTEELDEIFSAKERLFEKKIELKGFIKGHVLISFPLDSLIEFKEQLETIGKIPGVEIETSAN